jgi:hypothetical protein
MFLYHKSTRNDKTLDLLFMNNPSFVNITKTLPIGESDYDIIFNEINFALPTVKRHLIKYIIYTKKLIGTI